jgi:hypothetical protein
VLADDHVEGGGVEWQRGDIGGADLDRVAEPDRVVEPSGDLAVLGGEVDRGDASATFGGDQPGRAADSGAGIEDPVALTDLSQVDQGGGGETAEAVEVLQQREVGGVQRLEILPGRGQGTFERVRPVA